MGRNPQTSEAIHIKIRRSMIVYDDLRLACATVARETGECCDQPLCGEINSLYAGVEVVR